MSPAGFEPSISASEWPRTHTLESAALGVGSCLSYDCLNLESTRGTH